MAPNEPLDIDAEVERCMAALEAELMRAAGLATAPEPKPRRPWKPRRNRKLEQAQRFADAVPAMLEHYGIRLEK